MLMPTRSYVTDEPACKRARGRPLKPLENLPDRRKRSGARPPPPERSAPICDKSLGRLSASGLHFVCAPREGNTRPLIRVVPVEFPPS